MMDTWGYLEMYSTATVVSKPSNFAAFRVVTSTTNPTYQVLVTTQGNVGISTGNPTEKLEVSGTIYSNSGGFKFPDGTAQTTAAVLPASPQNGDILYYSNGDWTRLAVGSNGQSLKVSGGGIDSYTKLMIHADGTDASTTFADSAAGKTVTAHDNAQIDTAQSKFGGASGYFDGDGDYLTLSASEDWNLGGGDFTIDFWIYLNSTGRQYFFGMGTDTSTHYVLGLDYNSVGSNKLGLWASSNGSSWDMIGADSGGNGIGSTTLTLNTWHHIAVVRNGSNWKVYIDGVVDINLTVSGTILNPSGRQLNVARCAYLGGSFHLNGNIDEFRWSKNIARWTANFTPPASAYTSSTNLIWSN